VIDGEGDDEGDERARVSLSEEDVLPNEAYADGGEETNKE